MTTAPHVPALGSPTPSSPTPGPPAPPPGPGVHPPFPAPPVEGRGRRIGLGFGIAGGVLVLVCGGGAVALTGFGLSLSGSMTERAQASVGDYLSALRDKKYDQAYRLLCERAQDDESPAAFRRRVTAADPIASWQLGDLNFVTLALPFQATYGNGTTASLEAFLGQDTDTGEFEVCEVGE